MTSEFAIGVHALVYMNHKREIVSSEALSENICANPARIRKVMAKLKKYNLINTKEGLGGGYYLEKKVEDITLKDVSDALEEETVKITWKTGDEDNACMIASGMGAIMDDIYGTINKISARYLSTISIKEIENTLMKNKKERAAL